MRVLLVSIVSIVSFVSLVATPASAAPRRDKREVPDYDGRAPAPTSALDVARIAARVVLFPVYLVADFVVRRPLGFVVRNAEHSRTGRRVVRYLFLGPKSPTPSIFPVALYDFGFQPSIGLRLVWTDGFLTPGSRLSAKVGTGGLDWWRVDGAVRAAIGKGVWVGGEAGARHRPDHVFYGIGGRTEEDARARYGLGRRTIALSTGWRGLTVTGTSMRQVVESSDYSGDPSIEEQVDAGRIAGLPDGYPGSVATFRIGARVALDSRSRKRQSSGARLDGTIERVWGLDDTPGQWTHVDVTVGGALLVDPVAERKLDLRLRTELVDAAAGVAVPFLDLAIAGGSRDLRGFASGRLRDATAIAFTVDYEWPLAAWLDATLYLGVGNVFGRRFSGFSAGKLRGSAGLGLSLAGLSEDRRVEVWAATATDPFDEGGEPSSFRLVLGYSNDY